MDLQWDTAQLLAVHGEGIIGEALPTPSGIVAITLGHCYEPPAAIANKRTQAAPMGSHCRSPVFSLADLVLSLLFLSGPC